MITHLIVGLIKKTLYKYESINMSLPKRFKNFGGNTIALKTNLTSLKTEVDKLDMDKLVPVPVDLNKLSNVVKMML